MPTPGSLSAEDSAIETLLDHLRQSGGQPTVVARPDREKHHPLTVDAIVSIGGTEWAIDVCAASLSSRQRTASDHAENVLRPPLEAIAAAHGCGIRVQCVAQEGERGEVWGEHYYQCLVEAARDLAPVGIGASRTVQDGAHVEVVDQTEAPCAGVQIWIWLGKGPDLAAELTRDLAGPVAKKLRGQLLQARLAGHRVGLLIDALTPPDTGNWRYFHATAWTVEEALLRLGAWGDGLDAAWFRNGQGELSAIRRP